MTHVLAHNDSLMKCSNLNNDVICVLPLLVKLNPIAIAVESPLNKVEISICLANIVMLRHDDREMRGESCDVTRTMINDLVTHGWFKLRMRRKTSAGTRWHQLRLLQ